MFPDLKAQLQDAKRRWEELQNFFHNVNAEREKLQASNQGVEHVMIEISLKIKSTLALIRCLPHLRFQSFTVSCWPSRRKWTTRTRSSRPCTAAWPKPWSPRRGWSRKWWSWWRCHSIVSLTSPYRPRSRWVVGALDQCDIFELEL